MSFFSSLSALEKFVIICDGDILVPDRTVCEPKVEVVVIGAGWVEASQVEA